MDEERCVDSCAGKLIRSNHRLMGTYVQLMPRMVQRRMEEMESKAAENAKAAEAAAAAAAASAAVGPTVTDTSQASQPTTPSIPTPHETPLLPPSVTDIGPEVHGSVLKPAGSEIPVELDLSAATQVKLSAATLLTPATETLNPSELNTAGSGPSYTADFPQLPPVGSQIESGSSVPVSVEPVFTPSKTTSLSEDMPLSAVAAPPVSKSTESQSGQE